MKLPIGLPTILAEISRLYPNARLEAEGEKRFVYVEKGLRGLQISGYKSRWLLESWEGDGVPVREQVIDTKEAVIQAVKDWLQ